MYIKKHYNYKYKNNKYFLVQLNYISYEKYLKTFDCI